MKVVAKALSNRICLSQGNHGAFKRIEACEAQNLRESYGGSTLWIVQYVL